MDWNDWVAEIVAVLNQHNISHRIISEKWGHIRHEYRQGTSPAVVTKWLLERVEKYNVLEARIGNGIGKIIATNLSEYDAERMIERFYDEEKVWWKEKCCTNQKESSDIA